VGEGRWTFEQHGEYVEVTYDWRVRAHKPLLRKLSWLLKPLFSANHRWAMARGRESLDLELSRKRAAGAGEPAVPVSPPSTARSGLWLSIAAAALAVALMLSWMAGRRGHAKRPSQAAASPEGC
jgi:hypothetical protein